MAKEFEKLLPFSFRGQEMPISNIVMSLAHDLVEHKYWGVDGARVEATGLAPLRISAVIPITNHIVPGPRESWKAGTLYPDQLRWFISSFARRDTGILVHPEFGEITCKAERMEFALTGDRQGATEIHASWVETTDDSLEVDNWRNGTSPVQELQQAAITLTADLKDLKSKVPNLPEFKLGLEDLARKLQAIGDVVTVLAYRGAGVINNILYQCKRVQASVERAKDATTWPIIQNVQRVKSAAYDLRKELLSPGGIGVYTVPRDTTLAGVVVMLPKGTPMGDVIKLNPSLVRSPVVLAGSSVRYPMQSRG